MIIFYIMLVAFVVLFIRLRMNKDWDIRIPYNRNNYCMRNPNKSIRNKRHGR